MFYYSEVNDLSRRQHFKARVHQTGRCFRIVRRFTKKYLERLRPPKSIHTNPLTQSAVAAVYFSFLFFSPHLKCQILLLFKPRSLADEVRPHSHSSPRPRSSSSSRPPSPSPPRRQGNRPILPRFLHLLQPLWPPVSSLRPRGSRAGHLTCCMPLPAQLRRPGTPSIVMCLRRANRFQGAFGPQKFAFMK